ncbi:iron chelate uptake ABC transporter family permease subunit [Frankia sp. CNm7]|uniref:Iron chelate uptake ABC transporter family permease subunit n=1 Tax=Frankia nepalensis TaxID=1836974 RepID=A0A937RA42_9ACTN|nr:iron chelate uptake ABC transporter family permease subunit [Frankia nepalensis]MBL7501844.1 iron chelate uptake ABC transporter family permease subunit [Frankia nepalensis]MBL7515022.1 iron chelate uptake ABC transporter family permease subunit [Frankia nepalensis]MBL7518732.1 iron chelate uptake ABC transporter family permease subunit [Frankia nepalensis]MBL7625932.1 iron chelate uptake ABC transporter family permease subunit [Frankia nepalensis]
MSVRAVGDLPTASSPSDSSLSVRLAKTDGPDPPRWPAAPGPDRGQPAPVPDPTAAPTARRWRARAAGLVAAAAALALLSLLSVGLGSNRLPLTDVWRVLWHDDGSEAATIVHDLRLPRTLLGIAVGVALGGAGALAQALTRNVLADPGLLGVNLGASAAVVTAIAFLGVSAPAGYVWFAFVGAAGASVLVYLLGATGRAATRPDHLVVAGAAISAVLLAYVNAVSMAKPSAFDQFRFWDVGSLSSRGAAQLDVLAPIIAVGAVLTLCLARPLNALALGEDAGRGLGVHVRRTRLLAAIAVTLLCGAATAAAGPIVFVGLAVPHVARMIGGADQRWVLPYSMVLAPILLVGSDVVGRVIIAPGELEVGVITAFVGAPVFIVLCRRARLARL